MENAVSSIELPDISETSAAVSPPSAFSEVIEKFNHVEEDRGMIVHEQLSVMSRYPVIYTLQPDPNLVSPSNRTS